MEPTGEPKQAAAQAEDSSSSTAVKTTERIGFGLPVVTPTFFLLTAGCTFAAGAYGGYRREMKRVAAAGGEGEHYVPGSSGGGGGGGRRGGLVSRMMEGEAPAASASTSGSAASSSKANTIRSAAASQAGKGIHVSPAAPALAARALAIGSMLSIGGVGLLSAAVFYSSGANSLDELIQSLREWTPRKRRQVEEYIGLPKPASLDHPDVVATKGMSEDEELEYVKRKYMSDMYKDES